MAAGRADVDNLRRGMAILAARLAAQGLGRVQVTPDGLGIDVERRRYVVIDPTADGSDLVDRAAVGFHHMCTTRMTDDPTRGVVDPSRRLHSVANVYVAGSAVFPTGGASTPTLTIVALALRLADHLRDQVLA